MAGGGLIDVVDAAFSGGKPGPTQGTNVNKQQGFLPMIGGPLPREGSNLIFDALGSSGPSPRAQRAMNRRRGQT